MNHNRRLLSFCATVLVAAWATVAQGASFVSDTDVILNPDETLVETFGLKTEWITSIGLPKISTAKTSLSNPTGGISPPGPGQTVNSFFDIFVEIELDGLDGGPFSGSGVGSGSLSLHNIGSSGQDGVEIDWESLSVTLRESPTLPSPREVMLRESPSKASVGHTAIRESPTLPGHFQIDSFFDIFTELSVDGGQSWIPASSAMHLESVPEPSTFVLGAFGIMGLGFVARRKKNRRA